MKCQSNHGPDIRGISDEVFWFWTEVHNQVLDGETQANRFRRCVRELTDAAERQLRHLAVHHLPELLTVLPQDIRYGAWEWAIHVRLTEFALEKPAPWANN